MGGMIVLTYRAREATPEFSKWINLSNMKVDLIKLKRSGDVFLEGAMMHLLFILLQINVLCY